MSKIALIIPYFGKWPPYIDFFFDSLSRNPIINLFLFTDIEYQKPAPGNVRIIPFSLGKFNRLGSEVLGINIEIERPYKLCELKPCYGLVFRDYIRECSHWAYGDLDLIFGNVEKMLPEDWASQDVMSMRTDWITGSFAVFRNSEVINRLFMESASWEKAFTSKKYLGFDECSRNYAPLFESDEKFLKEDQDKQSMTYLVKKGMRDKTLQARFELKVKERIPIGDHVFYNAGTLTQSDGKELLYYHYITEKKTYKFVFPTWNDTPEKFYINAYGFYRAGEFHSWKGWMITAWRILRGAYFWTLSVPRRGIRRFNRMRSELARS